MVSALDYQTAPTAIILDRMNLTELEVEYDAVNSTVRSLGKGCPKYLKGYLEKVGKAIDRKRREVA